MYARVNLLFYSLIKRAWVSDMNKLMDKFMLFVITLALYVWSVESAYMIAPILFTVILSATLSYLENERITIGIFAFYILFCFYEPAFLYFIPLLFYDVLFVRVQWLGGLALLPLILNSAQVFRPSNVFIAIVLALAYRLKYRTHSFQRMKKEYYELQYTSREMSLQLEQKNKALIEKQDYEINLATLNERNRIARDIHDNVGHMLSRSILQIGALLTVSKDPNIKESLDLIKDTLSEAMNSIRNSVHNLHEESIDLYTELQKLVSNFKFCSIQLDYDIETNLDRNLKYCFISVTKEALSNVIKHSNATKVSVLVREHPALYQLVIQDNGTQGESNKTEKGIGLKNIADRVAALEGNVNISFNRGFRIFLSIPKK